MNVLAWFAAALAVHAAPIPGTGNEGAGNEVYVVKRDETLLEIAHRGLTSTSAYAAVQRLNKIGNDRRIPVGTKLLIPRPLLRVAPIQATVDGLHGAATSAVSGAPRPLNIGDKLTEGALILTGENASVRLGLPDGSHLAIPSNSRIRLDRLRAVVLTGGIDRQVSVQTGGLESQVTPMTNPSSRFVVVTPVAQSAVRGTEFRVAYDAVHDRANAGVLKGAVGVNNAKAAILVPAGKGVVATAGGVTGLLSLPPAPVLQPASAAQTGERLHFSLAPVPGAGSYRLVIGADPKVEVVLVEHVSDKPEFDLPPLPDGAYFVKVTAISRDGLEGLPAISPITRVRAELTIVGARAAGGAMEFSWTSPGDTPAAYRFVLARRAAPDRPVVDEGDLAAPRFTVPALAPGDYIWTVFAQRMIGGRRMQIVSDPQSLHVP
jgi:hypothetical protein